MAVEIPEEIGNTDIKRLLAGLVIFDFQLAKSSAADQSDGFPVEADMTRLVDRIGDILSWVTYASSQPLQDAPETHGRIYYPVPVFEEVPEPSNIDVNRLRDSIKLFYMEMVFSQSARNTNGIGTFDTGRALSYIASITSMVEDYIKPRTPNDLPNVSPINPLVGPGN